ncbi:adenylate/guanylate cyclase domain-containing protein [Ulvibacterium marinum]|uniref:Adenylate/guanylate cyclase domain-containing protein n=1 Tax=Ulvibacterium marinum TaxID=2419782 RepID=A0A3B0C542_9FLAO|nr:adenylate/guanylate cyclase domain-containing protein [Ulvibacterium marinum]RKN78356.1 adenylate/guanylate cyclase domain-containing protein [Ulvibacterium marinum]
MLSPRAKRNIARIIPFGLIWLVLGLVFLTVEQVIINSSDTSSSSAIRVDFEILVFACLAVTAVGLLVGAIELLFLNKLFAKKSFLKKIFYKLFIYLVFSFLVILIMFPIAAAIEIETHVLDNQVWKKYHDFLNSAEYLSTLLQMMVSLGVSLMYAEISDNIGHGVLINFFTGKYHRPKEEERIFMFADMKSSTAIAETLGHIKYFELLRTYYYDLSSAIVNSFGEVYQYVGDEIVVSWTSEKGIQNNNCIQCFFNMKKDLKKKSDWYQKHFGISPDFKAGFHFGKVTTGEIGALKKEIIFTGDVMNTTARIQSLCNEHGVDIIVSDHLLNHLNLGKGFKIESLGEHILKGKEKKIGISTVHQNTIP